MPRCRPFKLVDAMILVAAAALWLASMRQKWNEFQMTWAGTMRVPTWQAYVELVQDGWHIAFLYLALMAYVYIRLVPPRLPMSDLIRQPGVLFLGLMIAFLMSRLALALVAFVPPFPPESLVFALALGLSWYVACRRYRSRAEPGWIEVLGRSFGVGLVVSDAANYPLYLLNFLAA